MLSGERRTFAKSKAPRSPTERRAPARAKYHSVSWRDGIMRLMPIRERASCKARSTRPILLFSSVVIVVVGAVSGLPLAWLIPISGALVLFAVLSLRRAKRGTGNGHAGPWVMLSTGAVFLFGGLFGAVQSVHENWHWVDRLPLLLPLSIGLCVIWLAFKQARQRA